MRLNGFSVENFRSIQKSGWCEISAEEVAVLVGQNEAGKSSILEALMAFQIGKVDVNDLRSDGGSPSVQCEYQLTADELKKSFAPLLIILEKSWNENYEWPATKLKVISNWLPTDPSKPIYSIDCYGAEGAIDEIARILASDAPEVVALESMTTIDPSSNAAKLQALDAKNKACDQFKIQLKDTLITVVKSQLPTFVLFNDTDCLLPSTIDLVKDELEAADGRVGAQNFLTVAGLDVAVLLNTTDRHRATMLAKASKNVTADFQTFWTQQVGKTQKVGLECDLKYYDAQNGDGKSGNPYLVFYISEANDKLYPSQRSKGVRWFLSFFLQIWAAAKSHKSVVFLLDEPGSNLHSKAQQNVLQVIERSCNANQVIYSTHSPDLIRADKLGRVLAVQRDDTDDLASPTTVISAHRLSGASVDTMSAVYRAMGADFSHQQVIQKSNNILLEELSALYYLKAFHFLTASTATQNFLPATGVTNIPMIANLLTGWGIEFLVVLDDDTRGRDISKTLLKELFLGDEELFNSRVHRIKKCDGIEDLFDPQDYARHVLNQSNVRIEGKCSAQAKSESKGMLAYQFWCKVEKGEIQTVDLNQSTITNITNLLSRIGVMFEEYKK
jgi:predicted ATPase